MIPNGVVCESESSKVKPKSLLVLLLRVNLEEGQAVASLVLGISDDTNVVTDLGLLQEALGQVLEVALGEGHLGGDDDGSTRGCDGDAVTQNTNLAVDLDAIVQVLDEALEIEDLLLGWLRAVDDELLGLLADDTLVDRALLQGGLLLGVNDGDSCCCC